ncbi:peptidoglycan-recognition protein LF-like [Macrosteles quadrilineatus]|uniref:peptidoglycan-recognition protein LF-like n=1 Tax=Macrosteles quadrilineatus TaxID=74068 RepID=UPI0023E17D37|nr:peptidoglycan-recognition protein LF-like [Macrosteles quadrilineatus]
MLIDVENELGFEKKEASNYERKHFRRFVNSEPVKIISRDEWGAEPPTSTTPLPGNIVKHVLYVYQTHTSSCRSKEECSLQLQDLQQRCFDNNKPDIFYNFMVGGDGKVYECRGWFTMPDKYNRLGDHMDPSTIYVGYIGDFADIHPNIKQWHAGWKLLEYGFRNNLISEPDFRLYYCS